MNVKTKNLLIGLSVGGAIFLAGVVASAIVPGLNIVQETTIMAIVVGGGLFAGLNGRAGNRKLPTASDEARSQALAFPRVAGKGYVVIVRRARSGGSVGFDVMVDGSVVAQLMSQQFIVLPIASGKHSLFVDIPGAPGKSAAVAREVVVAEGDVMFFETRTSMGMTRTSVHVEPLADTPGLRTDLNRTAMVMPLLSHGMAT